jgi:hypothetical protein
MSKKIFKDAAILKLTIFTDIVLLFVNVFIGVEPISIISSILWNISLWGIIILCAKHCLSSITISSTGLEWKLLKKTYYSVKWNEIKYVKIKCGYKTPVLSIYTDESEHAEEKLRFNIKDKKLAIIKSFCTNEAINQQIDSFKRPLFRNY